MRHTAPLLLLLIAMASGCSREKFSDLAEEFTYTTLSFSPVAATAAGLHNYGGKNLDQLLDDVSTGSFDRQRQFYRRFQGRLEKLRRDSLTPQDQADYDIIADQIGLSLLELDIIQSYAHNPTLYVELIGNALFTPFVQEYAPKNRRFEDIM